MHAIICGKGALYVCKTADIIHVNVKVCSQLNQRVNRDPCVTQFII